MTTISSVGIGSTSQTTVGALTVGSLAPGFTIVTPALGGTGVNNSTSTLTLGGNLTTSGAFASTFTMTNTTAVTFPVSGTLATTSQLLSTPVSGANGGTGVANTGSTITIGGNVTFSGAFTFAGTLTGNTAVTFPTSGTLATTSQLPSLPLSLANGGTNANLTANDGGIFYSTSTAGAILAGTATARQMLQSGASTTPAWSTTTWPATTTANRILYSSATNVIGEITSANSAMLVTDSSGVPAFSGTMTNGQLIIGSTGATPTAATLTAGSGISITDGAGSITITATSASITWSTVTGATQTMAAANGYIANRATSITFTVPATAAVGDQFIIEGLGAGLTIVQMNTGQTCHFGDKATTSAGTMTATNQYDAITITCTVANTTFNARGQGNWTMA